MKLFSAYWSPVQPVCAGPGKPRRSALAFTIVEIAIALGVIGFALVAIIGVLPTGMQVQRQNREETIINQDATVFIDAIRNGARGLDDLTNYVVAITNYVQRYAVTLTDTNPVGPPFFDGYTYTNSTAPFFPITNGLRIIGLLSMPKFTPVSAIATDGFYSNHVVAFVRALSGNAAEKYPQNNADILHDAFGYRLITEITSVPAFAGATLPGTNSVARQLANNLHEVRLLFRWPLLPNGSVGNGRQTFRTLVGGQLMVTNDPAVLLTNLYFFEPQTFAAAP